MESSHNITIALKTLVSALTYGEYSYTLLDFSLIGKLWRNAQHMLLSSLPNQNNVTKSDLPIYTLCSITLIEETQFWIWNDIIVSFKKMNDVYYNLSLYWIWSWKNYLYSFVKLFIFPFPFYINLHFIKVGRKKGAFPYLAWWPWNPPLPLFKIKLMLYMCFSSCRGLQNSGALSYHHPNTAGLF